MVLLSFAIYWYSVHAKKLVSEPPFNPETMALSELFPANEEYQFTTPVVGTYALPPIKSSPDGAILNHEDQKKSLANILKGKISLVSFVYLLCSDVNGCPLAMATLFDIYDATKKVPNLKDKVQLITLSFDPTRDTTEAIASFAYPMLTDKDADKKINWHVLTTDGQKSLKPILDGFGQVVNRSGDSDTIRHLLRLFLVDETGQIRNIYGLGMIDPRLIMADIETLIKETK
ncbi:MAG: SCO family protein [Hyphomicrobiales bacterium]